MRIRTGHGPDDWQYGPPASPGSSKIGGTIHFGAPGPNDKDAHRREAAASKAKLNGQKRIVTP